MQEHLGLLPEQRRKPPSREIDLDDPVADSFFIGTWGAIARKNTEIFERVKFLTALQNEKTCSVLFKKKKKLWKVYEIFLRFHFCYFQVFNVLPTDKLKDFEELRIHVSKIPLCESVPQVAEEYLRDLIGNLVEFPLNFLSNANLAPGFASKEGIVPSSVFT